MSAVAVHNLIRVSRFKYSLAVLEVLIAKYGSKITVLYDIACRFEPTLQVLRILGHPILCEGHIISDGKANLLSIRRQPSLLSKALEAK